MSRFRQVEDREAGPSALGVLVPPGRQTFVILRPRALPWDLVLTHDSARLEFREIFRDEAARAVEAVRRALETWADGGPGQVFAEAAPQGQWVHCMLGEFHFIVCRRV